MPPINILASQIPLLGLAQLSTIGKILILLLFMKVKPKMCAKKRKEETELKKI